MVGVNSAGEAAATPVALELGEENGASLTIDGNKANLEESLSVSGTALYVSNDSAVTIHDDVTFANHRKTENVRTIADGLGSAANIGGAAIIAASGSVTITGATFENNESVGEGGAVYLAADATTAITDAEFSGNKATAKKTAEKKAPAAAKGAKKRQPNAAFMKPQQPDEVLAKIVGSKAIPRTEIVKKLWAYIKKHDLQDKTKKTMINADEAMKAFFDGKDQISMFQMTKQVSLHINVDAKKA